MSSLEDTLFMTKSFNKFAKSDRLQILSDKKNIYHIYYSIQYTAAFYYRKRKDRSCFPIYSNLFVNNFDFLTASSSAAAAIA